MVYISEEGALNPLMLGENLTIAEGVLNVDIPDAGPGLPEDSVPYQQLVTDADGKVEWAERLAYTIETERSVMPETVCEFVGSGSAHWNNAGLPASPLNLTRLMGSRGTVSLTGVPA
jgi:hypothetical protein